MKLLLKWVINHPHFTAVPVIHSLTVSFKLREECQKGEGCCKKQVPSYYKGAIDSLTKKIK